MELWLWGLEYGKRKVYELPAAINMTVENTLCKKGASHLVTNKSDLSKNENLTRLKSLSPSISHQYVNLK